MKGLNELYFNQITMQAAIQHYLNTVLFREGQAPTVTEVSTVGYQFRVQTKANEEQGK